MPSEHQCFLLVPVDFVELVLRRFITSRDGGNCPAPPRARYPGAMPAAMWHHTASVVIDRLPGPLVSSRHNADDLILTTNDPEIPHDDPRWPTHCECGYVFGPESGYQTNRERLYRRTDTGEIMTIDAAPVGAMWNATWYLCFGARFTRHSPDWCLEMKTPAGRWIIDGPANNGDGWKRVGEPPNIVATPSIGIGAPVQRMHGFLGGPAGDRPGVLTIDKP